MKISVSCEKCGKKLKAPESLAGKRAKCSKCGAIVQIPMPQDDSDETGFELEVIEDESPRKPKSQTPLAPPDADKTPVPTFESDTGPLDLLDDLLEPELPASALVAHDSNTEQNTGRGKGRAGGGPAAESGDGGMESIMARAAETAERRGPKNAPAVLFSFMGIDFTPVKSIAVIVIVMLLIGGGIYWFTGPGKNLRIYDAQPVTALIAIDSLARHDAKGMAGISLGKMGVKPPVSPLGSQFKEESYGLGGPDRLIFTRPDPNGDYLLVHLKVSQRIVAEEHMENRYDNSFYAGAFILQVGGKEITPMLIMGKMPNEPFEFNTAGTKVTNIQDLLPNDAVPDEYNDLVGTEKSIASASLVFNGKNNITGKVNVRSNRKLYDQPGVSGVSGTGELIQKDPYSGMTLKYEYLGKDMRISWNGPATAWWSSDQYLMTPAVSPFATYDIYLLYRRPQTTDNMVIKLNSRIVGTLPSSLAAKAGQVPSTVTVADVPAATANINPTVKTDSTPTTPQEAAQAMAGGKGGTGGQPAAGSGKATADPGMFDYFGALARARDMGKGVIAQNNMKQLGMGVLMYAEKNNGELPPDIDHMRTVLGDINKLLENVRTNTNPGYLYIKPAKNIKMVSNPTSTPILYELRGTKLDRDGAIMYLDGHIELPKK